jgi:hypothetical protein
VKSLIAHFDLSPRRARAVVDEILRAVAR